MASNSTPSPFIQRLSIDYRWTWSWYSRFRGRGILIFLACSYFQVISPKKCGFFCNDQSINYPYTGDTVSIKLLLAINLSIPILSVLLIETWQQNGGEGCIQVPRKWFRPCLRSAGRIILEFILGKLFAILVAEMLKINICEKRPHFLDTCRPDIDYNKCQQQGFITNYTCTGASVYSWILVRDSYKSFPSAHATSAFYASVFLILYLQVKMRGAGSSLLCFFSQVLCFIWATYCAVSRVTDHRHHWWDVLFGSLIGILISIAAISVLTDWFFLKRTAPPVLETPDLQDNRVSTRRLISTSSDPKEMETVAVKTLETTNHV